MLLRHRILGAVGREGVVDYGHYFDVIHKFAVAKRLQCFCQYLAVLAKALYGFRYSLAVVSVHIRVGRTDLISSNEHIQ